MKRVLATLWAVLVLSAPSAFAQNYPTRPVTLIVPFAAGGPTDIVARIVGEYFSKTLGQQFIIENIAGAGGTTGIARGAQAKPDGYTIMMGHMGTHGAAPALYPNLRYDPANGFEPIGLVAGTPILIVARKDFPAKDLKEFIAKAKDTSTRLSQAHAGVGSVSYTGCLLLNAAIGIKPTLVPFTGTAPAMNALLAGQVDYVCDPILGPLPHVRAGTVKAHAIATAKRHPALPDVPTSAEGGLPQFSAAPFYAVFAPKGTPQPVLDRLIAALDSALDHEAARKRLIDLGAEIAEKGRRGPAPLAALVKSEIARLTPILQAAAGK